MLLVLLVLVVFVLPVFLKFGDALQIITDIAVALILVAGVVAVAEHRGIAIALSIVSLIVVAMRIAEWFALHDLLPLVRNVSVLLALLLLATAVGINVFASRRGFGDRLFGAIVLYLLLGLIWGVVYATLGTHTQGSFAGNPDSAAGLSAWIYFSFVTLTTVGYGDITPVAMGARSLAILEALVGQLYPAVIIARLVSLQDSSTK